MGDAMMLNYLQILTQLAAHVSLILKKKKAFLIVRF